ncbi:uncharacterized protein LOC110982640 [Acanthaster planci]|uniref:Uncharacterized protein LOC110982640 n=1 Tax=Acanthaster planci TaxID=133434 RepID=A0A8B7YWN1_ACAPL|nr:uncharacterized protein LOC110982640 [Acanthaster planci]
MMAKQGERRQGEADRQADDFNMSGFSELPDDLDDHFMASKDSKHTRAVVATSVNVLSDYCTKSADCSTTLAGVEQMTPRDLCQFLRSFYSGVRQKDGSFYARRSMLTLRYGLQRHFQKLLQVDIVNDATFKGANDVFNTVLANLKTSVKMNHVRKKNMAKIRSSSATDCSTPRGLQNTVFLDLMLHLACSTYGRHNLRGMKKLDFMVMMDPMSNRRYVCFAHPASKHLAGSAGIQSDESDDDQVNDYSGNFHRMYETPEKPDSCPVRCFEKYASKLHPMCGAFWQRPKKAYMYSQSDKYWYDAVPLGKNALGNKMRDISAEAGCSTMYSNQCLKVTGKMMNHASHSGCRAKCNNHYYGEIMTSSEEDDSESERDEPNSGVPQNVQQENDTCNVVMSVESRVDGQECNAVPIKLEEDKLPTDHQQTSGSCNHTAHCGMEHELNVPSIRRTSFTTETPSQLYPVHINVTPNYGNPHQGPADQQEREHSLNGIDQDAWCVERTWVDEKSQRKWLLTKRKTTRSVEQDAWRQAVELQTQRNATLTGHLGPLPIRDLGNPDARSAVEVSSNLRAGSCPLADGPSPSSSSSGDDFIAPGLRSLQSLNGVRSGIQAQPAEDDELLQLQKTVLMMQQKNLALERQKIKLEMAKLEAERLKLEAERRKLSIEGDKLQRELL